jgi:hypothetical protein
MGATRATGIQMYPQPEIHRRRLKFPVAVVSREILVCRSWTISPGEMGRRDIRVIRGIMAAAESGKAHEFGH